MLVNDIHSELNETAVREVVAVVSVAQAQHAIREAAASGAAVAIAAGRHAIVADGRAPGFICC